MALAAGADYTTMNVQNVASTSLVAKAASNIWDGALCMQNDGECEPFDGTQTATIVGFHFGDKVEGSATAPRPRASITPGGIKILRLAVTGVTGAADEGDPVYATDDNTFTVTDPGTGKVVGRIAAFRAAGVADVQFVAMPI